MAQRQWRSDDTSVWTDKFGSGSAGAYTTAGNLTDSSRTGFSNTTFTGTTGETAGTAGTVGNFAAGDLILIHQTRIASGAGVWELNKISSVGAGTNWTLAYALTNTYANYSQVYRLIQYSTVTIDTGHTLTGVAWGGTTGGIVAFIANGDITITGNITATGKGYRGGASSDPEGVTANQGESSIGAGASSNNANGIAGGGGTKVSGSGGAGGGGAGHSTAGTAGSNDGSSVGGKAGGTIVDASLVTLFPGGGGGGGSRNPTIYGIGGPGGGIVILIGKTITVTGTIVATGNVGGAGESSGQGAGGSGSGGSILLKGKTITLGGGVGTEKVKAIGGVAQTSGTDGGAGGVGHIHADYSVAISGTTLPTLDSTLDPTITSGVGSLFFNQL